MLRFICCFCLTHIAFVFHNNTTTACGQDTLTDNLTETSPNLCGDVWVEFSFLIAASVIMAGSCLFNVLFNIRTLQGQHGTSLWFQTFGFLLYTMVTVHLVFLAVDRNHPGWLDHDWLKYFSGILIFACWSGFTSALRFIMIGRLYNLGLYIRIIKEVIVKVIMFLGLYITLLMAFTLAFGIMIPDKFDLTPASMWQIPKTMSMLVGEIQYEETFKITEGKKFFIPALFLIFTILVPVIINNLLIGFTVSDVDKLLKSVNMSAIEFKLRNIQVLDETFMMGAIDYIAKKFFKESSMVSYEGNSYEVTF